MSENDQFENLLGLIAKHPEYDQFGINADCLNQDTYLAQVETEEGKSPINILLVPREDKFVVVITAMIFFSFMGYQPAVLCFEAGKAEDLSNYVYQTIANRFMSVDPNTSLLPSITPEDALLAKLVGDCVVDFPRIEWDEEGEKAKSDLLSRLSSALQSGIDNALSEVTISPAIELGFFVTAR